MFIHLYGITAFVVYGGMMVLSLILFIIARIIKSPSPERTFRYKKTAMASRVFFITGLLCYMLSQTSHNVSVTDFWDKASWYIFWATTAVALLVLRKKQRR